MVCMTRAFHPTQREQLLKPRDAGGRVNGINQRRRPPVKRAKNKGQATPLHIIHMMYHAHPPLACAAKQRARLSFGWRLLCTRYVHMQQRKTSNKRAEKTNTPFGRASRGLLCTYVPTKGKLETDERFTTLSHTRVVFFLFIIKLKKKKQGKGTRETEGGRSGCRDGTRRYLPDTDTHRYDPSHHDSELSRALLSLSLSS